MKTPLTEERKGEIALAMIIRQFRQDGIKLHPNMKRDILSKAKEAGIPDDDAIQFVGEMVHELVNEVFPPKQD